MTEEDKWLALKDWLQKEKDRLRHVALEGAQIKKGAVCQVLEQMRILEND